jgi:hypothetical protein
MINTKKSYINRELPIDEGFGDEEPVYNMNGIPLGRAIAVQD